MLNRGACGRTGATAERAPLRRRRKMGLRCAWSGRSWLTALVPICLEHIVISAPRPPHNVVLPERLLRGPTCRRGGGLSPVEAAYRRRCSVRSDTSRLPASGDSIPAYKLVRRGGAGLDLDVRPCRHLPSVSAAKQDPRRPREELQTSGNPVNSVLIFVGHGDMQNAIGHASSKWHKREIGANTCTIR